MRKWITSNQNKKFTPLDLLEYQRRSYSRLLQKDIPPRERLDIGLQTLFKTYFPVKFCSDRVALDFVDYSIGLPEFPPDDCFRLHETYSAPVLVTLRIILYEEDLKTIKEIKEQTLKFFNIPMPTANCSFIINGVERVVVSQIHKTPGVYFTKWIDEDGNPSFRAQIIPLRGNWVNIELFKNVFMMKFNQGSRMPLTALFKAFGLDNNTILDTFFKSVDYKISNSIFYQEVDDLLLNEKSAADVLNNKGEKIIGKDYTLTIEMIRKLKRCGVKNISINHRRLFGRLFSKDVSHNGEIIFRKGDEFSEHTYERICKTGIDVISLYHEGRGVKSMLKTTLLTDHITNEAPDFTHNSALKNFIINARTLIYRGTTRRTRVLYEEVEKFFENLFFNKQIYYLSPVGRHIINKRLNISVPETEMALTLVDLISTTKYLLNLYEGIGEAVDVDHMGNRRIKGVGELVGQAIDSGLHLMLKAAKDKMAFITQVDDLMPDKIIDSSKINNSIMSFFSTSPLSQLISQINPLSEVSHKRRLTALGPGGVSKRQAGFEVRDVHPSQFGRICFIETPEGQNVGLVIAPAVNSRINDLGFIEAPFFRVKDSVITEEVIYLTAYDELDHIIAPADTPINKEGHITKEIILARKNNEILEVRAKEVTLMDVAHNQIQGICSALIPFFEHNDGHRALMGSNMQKQATPLMVVEAPLIGTGIEENIGRDSSLCVISDYDGIIEEVDSTHISIKHSDGIKLHHLQKYFRTSHYTCYHQKPIVNAGDKVKKGDIIADGAAISSGEISLGKNMLVAFTPWNGYNYEDSILINERVLKEDVFTSVHVETYELFEFETPIGNELITRDNPTLDPIDLIPLDENGIVKVGTIVRPGDVLVSKISPPGEEDSCSSEEKLLMAIFGVKIQNVKDASLKLPPGPGGVVIAVEIIDRDGASRRMLDQKSIQNPELILLKNNYEEKLGSLIKDTKNDLKEVFQKFGQRVDLSSKGESVLIDAIDALSATELLKLDVFGDQKSSDALNEILENFDLNWKAIKDDYNERKIRLKNIELPDGVRKLVKVHIAQKRKLTVGDKLAGRYGNKGIVSRIAAEEDMPFLPDGRPVDVCLNPLGLPSRMNIGQLFEVHLGWAAKTLGEMLGKAHDNGASIDELRTLLKWVYEKEEYIQKIDQLSETEVIKLVNRLRKGIPIAVPSFIGASEADIKAMLEKAGLPLSGKTILYNGQTGEPFTEEVAVGVMYMLKLNHLVDDKIHARAIGPYSAITRQPLGGRAKFGGQRIGEMEVWAFYAHGAAYNLLEISTVKSDDVEGRHKMFRDICKGGFSLAEYDNPPEALNVLISELKSLCMDIKIENN